MANDTNQNDIDLMGDSLSNEQKEKLQSSIADSKPAKKSAANKKKAM